LKVQIIIMLYKIKKTSMEKQNIKKGEKKTNLAAKDKEKTDKENLKEKLEECQKLKDEYLSGWQRARADFLNYKKGEIERLEEVKRWTKEEIFLKILNVLDNLDKAVDKMPEQKENHQWFEGIKQIRAQLKKILKEEGIEKIEVEGKIFDPNFQEAIETIETKEKKSGEVVSVLKKGYLINGKLLRPAKVRVSK